MFGCVVRRAGQLDCKRFITNRGDIISAVVVISTTNASTYIVSIQRTFSLLSLSTGHAAGSLEYSESSNPGFHIMCTLSRLRHFRFVVFHIWRLLITLLSERAERPCFAGVRKLALG